MELSVDKPLVQLKDVFYTGTKSRLIGIPENEDKAVVTSKILSIDGNVVETETNIYKITNWL